MAEIWLTFLTVYLYYHLEYVYSLVLVLLGEDILDQVLHLGDVEPLDIGPPIQQP